MLLSRIYTEIKAMRALKYLLAFIFRCICYKSIALDLQHLNTVAQDEASFMYLSSHDGIYRYDGEHSLNLSSFTELPRGMVKDVQISDNSKLLVALYQNGDLWTLDLESLIVEKIANINAYKLAVLKDKVYAMEENQLTEFDLVSSTSKPIFANKRKLLDIDAGFGNLYVITHDGLFMVSDIGPSLLDNESINKGEVEATPHGVVYTKNSQLFYYSLSQGVTITNSDIANPENLTFQLPYFLYYTEGGQVNEIKLSTLEVSRKNIANNTHSYINLYSDKNDVLWGLTMNKLLRVDGQNKILDVNLDSQYNSIEYVNGDIWLGTSKGVYKYTHLGLEKLSWLNELLPKQRYDITAIKVFSGYVVIGTSAGAYQINISSKTVRQLTSSYIINVALVDDQVVLATNEEGVIRYDSNYQVLGSSSLNSVLPSLEVLNIDKFNGTTYVSTSKGLMAFDETQNGKLVFNENVLVTDVEKLNDAIYLATYGKGLFKRVEGVWKSIPSPKFIIELNVLQNKMYLQTNNGIHSLDTDLGFTVAVQGTLDHSFSTNSIRHIGNKIFAVSDRGLLTIFNDDGVEPTPATIVFTQSNAGTSPSSYIGSLEGNWLNIAVSAFDYYSERKGDYQYRLDNGKWITLNSPMLQLNGLKETHHKVDFRYVKGNKVSTVTSYEFRVPIAWYATNAALFTAIGLLILFVGLGVSILYFWVQSFHKVYRKNQTQFQQSRVTQAVVNLNAAKSLCGGNDTMLSEGLVKIQDTLDSLEPIAHSGASLGDNTLAAGLNLLQIQASMQAAMDIKFKFALGDTRLESQLERDIYSILYHSIKNAIEHSDATAVRANLLLQREGIEVSIEDNGTGIPFKARLHFGAGFYTMRQIAKAYKTKLKIKTGRNGTCILMNFPLIEAKSKKPVNQQVASF